MNGIGGSTIAEAKERMSAPEFDLWVQYRRRHGTLNLGLRTEQGMALVAFCANGRAGTLADYMPVRSEMSDADALAKAMAEWR